MENFTSTEFLPESSSSVDNSNESFLIGSNDESFSQKSSGDNDELLSSPTIIELVDHDGMSATLPQTSEELSRTVITRSITIICTIIRNISR